MESNWLPWLNLAFLVAMSLLVFFLRHRIQRWATRGIEHHYDKKLEEIRSELRRKEEALRAQFHQRSKDLDTLKSPAIQVLTAREKSLAEREIQALEIIWGAVERLAPMKTAARFMQSFNLEELCKVGSLDHETTGFFKQIADVVGIKRLQPTDAHRTRPFVPEACWMKFAAYQAIGNTAIVWLTMLSSGIADRKFIKESDVRDLIGGALPHQLPLLEKFGSGAMFLLMEELEQAVLAEVVKALRGHNPVPQISNAERINALAESLMARALAADHNLPIPK